MINYKVAWINQTTRAYSLAVESLYCCDDAHMRKSATVLMRNSTAATV